MFFNVPTWARMAGCPIRNEPFGTDYAAAVERAETVLLPAFDSWRSGGVTDHKLIGAAHGTLNWLFSEFRSDRRFTKLGTHHAGEPRVRFPPGRRLLLKDGRRLGEARLARSPARWSTRCSTSCCVVTDADGTSHARAAHDRQHGHEVLPPRLERRGPPQPGQGAGESVRTHGLVSSSRRRRPRPLPSFRRSAPRRWRWASPRSRPPGWSAGNGCSARPTSSARSTSCTTARRIGPTRSRAAREDRRGNWIPLFDDAGVPLYPEFMASLTRSSASASAG